VAETTSDPPSSRSKSKQSKRGQQSERESIKGKRNSEEAATKLMEMLSPAFGAVEKKNSE